MELSVVVNGAVDGTAAGVVLTAGTQALGFRVGPPRPRKPIRFAVGQPGFRSTTWRLWANANKSDVYVASRRTAAYFKASLHESGDWRYQWVTDDRQEVAFTPYDPDHVSVGRIVDQWRRPAENQGWTDALSICVPHEDVTSIPGDQEPGDDTQWIAQPPPGEGIEFRIMLARPRGAPLDLTPALKGGLATIAFVNGFRLINGEVVLLFAATERLDRAFRRRLAAERIRARRNVNPTFNMAPDSGPRSALMTQEHNGHRTIWDLSLSVR